MRLLVTGGSGQVGRALRELGGGHEVVAPSHAEMPIEDAAACARVVGEVRPDCVVHAAAMTDVDGCERDPARARALNAQGSLNVAQAAKRHGARMVLVSTDYVFDGGRGHYKETDVTAPINHYGRSKLEGERLVLAALPGAAVARTSVVFGPHKSNFVRWVRDTLAAGKPVRAARDQWVTPTAAHDVAAQVLALAEAQASGIWHTAGAERLSRLEMAQRIARRDGADPSLVQPVAMADLSWLAPRPRDASLDTTKVRALAQPMSFDDALATLDRA